MQFFKSLKELEEINNDAYYDELNRIAETYNLNNCLFSVGGVDLDEVAIRGYVTMYQECEKLKHPAGGYFWGDKGKDFEVEMKDPTWFELWVQANNMIPVVDDYHHCFLEGVCQLANGVWSFSMGS